MFEVILFLLTTKYARQQWRFSISVGRCPRVNQRLQEAGLGRGGGLPDVIEELGHHREGELAIQTRGQDFKFPMYEVQPCGMLGYVRL